MKLRAVAIVSTLMTFTLSYTQASTQSSSHIDSLVKQNSAKLCECMTKIGYIDSWTDFDVNFDKCLKDELEKSDIEQDKKVFEQYSQSMNENMETCDFLETEVRDLLTRPEPKLSDPIYNNSDTYQNLTKNIVGQYSLSFNSGHSPEGGPTLALLENQRYVIVSFGTVLVGDWRIVKGRFLHLLPYRTQYPFAVFGRYSPKLGNTTKTNFDGGGFGSDTLIHYGEISGTQPTLTPIFNADANCFKHPYIVEIPEIPNIISLAYNPNYENEGEEAIDIYTFINDQGFNDFYILEFNRLASEKAIKAIILEDELIFEQGKTRKRALPKAGSENALFYKEMSTITPFPTTLYYNLGGKSFISHDTNPEDYTFDNSLKAYVANTQCLEDCPAEDDYDNNDIFYEYRALEEVTQQQSQFKIADKSAINQVCDH